MKKIKNFMLHPIKGPVTALSIVTLGIAGGVAYKAMTPSKKITIDTDDLEIAFVQHSEFNRASRVITDAQEHFSALCGGSLQNNGGNKGSTISYVHPLNITYTVRIGNQSHRIPVSHDECDRKDRGCLSDKELCTAATIDLNYIERILQEARKTRKTIRLIMTPIP